MTYIPTRPVLRYHGGKWRLAPWIIAHLPAHRCYVEPFGGGASVLLRKPRSYAEVYNDLWSDVVNVFRVLRNEEQATRLQAALCLTPFAREEFQAVSGPAPTSTDPVERARAMIFRSMSGFGSSSARSDYPTGFRGTSSRSGTTPAHDWMNYPSIITDFVDRLRGVVIENREAGVVMRQHDGRATLHYVDPPYVHATRSFRARAQGYVHEMTDVAHRDLAEVLHSLKGMVVLSGYRCELYDELFGDWRRVERAALADGALKRTESLWFNPAAAQACPVGPQLFEHQPTEAVA